jgi:hypothetical protein
MVAPLHFEELYGLLPHDMIFWVQYLDGVLRIGQVYFKQCHLKVTYRAGGMNGQ